MAVLPLRSFSLLQGDEGLSAYLQQIRRFPMLSAAEEQRLAQEWQTTGNRRAAHTLVTSHLRLVAKLAMGYKGYGLPVSDLIAEGNLGMMQAVRKFDPHKGFRLATYAQWWIKAAIQEYILHSWSLVKMGTTAAQKKLFFGLRRLKQQLQQADSARSLTPAQVTHIAEVLDVSETEVASMEGRLAAGDYSLSAPLQQDGESLTWQDTLEDERDSPEETVLANSEQTQRRAALIYALRHLNDRERAIFTARRLADTPVTLETLAATHAISRERVRQIEARAFEKVQQAMQA